MDLKNVVMSITLAIFIAIGVSSCSKKSSPTDSADTTVTTTNNLAVTNTGLTFTTAGEVQLNGKTFRGIGVNYFDAFYRILLKASDSTKTKAGLKYLSDNHIPFIRFNANGFWPSEWALYRNNPALYFKYFDWLVAQAEAMHIGLIPSLFFNPCTISDIQGEGYGKWGDPTSKTITMMQDYTQTMVQRYKDSPAIWGWEFGNEMNAYTDLYEQAKNPLFLPAVNLDPTAGTPSTRVASKDSLTTPMLINAMTMFANKIRTYDKKHLIFTGNAMPEWNLDHRYRNASASTRWSTDQAADFSDILDAQNPSAVGTITVHMYHNSTTEKNRYTHVDYDLLTQAMNTSTALHRPLFVGEFGAPDSTKQGIDVRPYYDSMLNAIVAAKVPLSAMWVFDFSSQDLTFNVKYTPDDATNLRIYQLKEIITVNAQLKAQLGY